MKDFIQIIKQVQFSILTQEKNILNYSLQIMYMQRNFFKINRSGLDEMYGKCVT